MKILVIGSEGNVGRILVPFLIKKGHDVVLADIERGYRENFYQVDITQGVDLARIFMIEKPDVVYSLAAMVSRIASEENSVMTSSLNLMGLTNVIELCKMYNSKLIYFSTSEIYGNIKGELYEDKTIPQPNNRYGLTKYLGEQLVHYESWSGNLVGIIVRPFMLYHENYKIGDINAAVIEFVRRLMKNEKITVHRNSERSWMHLDDAVKVFEKLIYLNQSTIINVGSDEYILTEELAELICKKLKVENQNLVEYIDLPEKMSLSKKPNLTKMKDLLEVINLIGIDEGVERIIKHLKSNIKNEL